MEKRIHSIMSYPLGRKLRSIKIPVFIMAGLCAFQVTVCSARSESAHKPSFDVASVKSAAQCGQIFYLPSGQAMGFGESPSFQSGGRYIGCAPLKAFIVDAYGTDYSLIAGGPKWIENAQFQIDAKAGWDADKDQMRLMLQFLLEERFKLKIHSQAKRMDIYALVVAEGGARLKEAKDENGNLIVSMPSPEERHKKIEAAMRSQDPFQAVQKIGTFMSGGGGQIELRSNATTMMAFAKSLRAHVGRFVIDKTGIPGFFDIQLRFADSGARFDMRMNPGEKPSTTPLASEPSGLTIFKALEEQLGLKLEPDKGLLEFAIIDSVEKPSEN